MNYVRKSCSTEQKRTEAFALACGLVDEDFGADNVTIAAEA